MVMSERTRKLIEESRRTIEAVDALLAEIALKQQLRQQRRESVTAQVGAGNKCHCCGRMFRGRKHAKTCSSACRQKIYRESKKV